MSVCTLKTCTIPEQLRKYQCNTYITHVLIKLAETQGVISKACGVPVRNKGGTFLALAIAGVVFAVVAFILRIAASLGRHGRRLWWDDASMAVVVALAIPPAVLAPFREL